MAYEWVSPVATAATGIAGVTFTWLTSRSGGETQQALLKAEQEHTSDTARRLEKREAFTALLDALSDADNEIEQAGQEAFRVRLGIQSRLESEHDQDSDDEAIKNARTAEEMKQLRSIAERVSEAINAFDAKMHAVLLTGSEEVDEATRDVRADLLVIWGEMVDFGEWRFINAGLRTTLLLSMKVDLGYSSPPSE